MAKVTTKKSPSKSATFGILKELVDSSEVFEICVDGPKDIYYSTKEGLKDFSKTFKDEKALIKMIMDLTKLSGKKLKSDEKSFHIQPLPMMNIFVTLPPVALNGPTLNIIKLPPKNLTLKDLYGFGALEEKARELLIEIMKKDSSMLVGGMNGSGKTTLLNCLLHEVNPTWRMVTVERQNDLIIERKRTVRMIASVAEKSPVELVELASSMRPDSLVVSYIDGDEAWALVKVLRDGNTGLACITGENVFDCIKRLEIMVLSSNPHFTLETVRYAIAQAFKYIVFQAWKPGGKRVVSDIAELIYEDGKLSLKSLYKRQNV